MKLSENGAKVLILREGTKLRAYKDTKGIWTIYAL
jgi:GH24 family phage-related lysozyme (muramidase)